MFAMADTKILQAILDGLTTIQDDFERLEKMVDKNFRKIDYLLDKINAKLEKRFASA